MEWSIGRAASQKQYSITQAIAGLLGGTSKQNSKPSTLTDSSLAVLNEAKAAAAARLRLLCFDAERNESIQGITYLRPLAILFTKQELPIANDDRKKAGSVLRHCVVLGSSLVLSPDELLKCPDMCYVTTLVRCCPATMLVSHSELSGCYVFVKRQVVSVVIARSARVLVVHQSSTSSRTSVVHLLVQSISSTMFLTFSSTT